MKRFGFILVPILAILMITQVLPRMLSSGVSPQKMIMLSGVILVILFLVRPKKSATKTPEAVAEEVMDEFSANAFASDEALKEKFLSALKDIDSNMPKSAVSKLTKLAPLCNAQEDKYAVAMAAALAYRKQNDLKNAIREYNKAVVIHPTAKLAYTIGDCHQRLGYLDKAKDSYEFAMELEPENPQYPSMIATTCVGNGNYYAAMEYAQEALELDPSYSQALATMAICAGVRGEEETHERYLKLATESGYSESKILDTVKALKKRK